MVTTREKKSAARLKIVLRMDPNPKMRSSLEEEYPPPDLLLLLAIHKMSLSSTPAASQNNIISHLPLPSPKIIPPTSEEEEDSLVK
jgi:hypothetical protein